MRRELMHLTQFSGPPVFQTPVASRTQLRWHLANSSNPVVDTGCTDVRHHSVLFEHGTFGKPLLPESVEAFSQGDNFEHDAVTGRWSTVSFKGRCSGAPVMGHSSGLKYSHSKDTRGVLLHYDAQYASSSVLFADMLHHNLDGHIERYYET
ncbi:uncharacterized protein AKAW2_30851S [Aspergillus luchuensis]|uniref:Uncharacterized protein n=1 Tax=Aspergillus kawachii TaxID=1069201 RepID=A0A7R7WVN5_ASPKA|nr:uncharacterized protein AKAW2_30851S [Aspergillus luchuensis]BCR97532.1 hypothetical protein AKAW2_30851S [Aspergillus luchuensis]BCS09997.1 hypothetical protein ALUC_30814S [Aspergillus luchuensis]